MTDILKYIGTGIAGGLVVVLISSLVSSASFGGVYSQVEQTFREGVKVGTSNQFAIDKDGDITTDLDVDGDVLVSGGSLNVATSNTATSTVIGGCFQFYATSTATAHKFMASTTPGVMVSQYGSCP